MSDKPVAFHDLDRTQFPFRMRLLDSASREVLWEQIIHGAGAVTVPGFAPRKVLSEVTFPNGHQFVDGPDGEHEDRFVDVRSLHF